MSSSEGTETAYEGVPRARKAQEYKLATTRMIVPYWALSWGQHVQTALKDHPVRGDRTPRPVLRWAGSKRRFLPTLQSYIQERPEHYIEPFAGSSALFFATNPVSAVLGDMNDNVIALLEGIRDEPEEVYRIYSSKDDTSESYYEARLQFNCTQCRLTKGAILLYLNRLCFNGIYRVNKSGQYNVPYGGRRSTSRLLYDDLVAVSGRLSQTTLVNGDFDHTVRTHLRANSFIYLDPPFYTESARVFNEYDQTPFNLGDVDRLISLLQDIDKNGARFLLSYANVPEAEKLQNGWNSKVFDTARHIAGLSSHRKKSEEIVVWNF